MKNRTGITHYTRARIIAARKRLAQRYIDTVCFDPTKRDSITVAEMQFWAWVAK